MAKKRWLLLRPALGEQADMAPLLERACAYRHDSAHSRRLPAPTRDLLSGIALEVQNRVNTFMSKQDPIGSYFPRVTAALDSTGREATAEQLASSSEMVNVGPVVTRHVGDSVEVEVTAVDPQERDLEWVSTPIRTVSFQVAVAQGGTATTAASGVTYRARWTFTAENISPYFQLTVLTRAVGAAHHQWGDQLSDVAVQFAFRVLPPAPE